MSSSRRRPELRLSISQGRDGSQYHRGGTALNITGAGRLSISQGRDAREIPVAGEEFSLDIPFHRTELCQVQGVKPNYGSQYHRGGTALNIPAAGNPEKPRSMGKTSSFNS